MKIVCALAFLLSFIFAIVPINLLSDTVTFNGPPKHIAAFCVLAWLLDRAYPERSGGAKIAALIGYGVLIELVQGFIPYRSANIFDVFMDVIGIAIYSMLKYFVSRKSTPVR